ncbi:hypothetical protein TVAG_076310 [Trichomonas vaginalis G3]|uniref:Uncharacterized protein n=1 Tax=Trichomonas vaginalis (strain ATCC PRA-98 / G3) TaxID=412133 RepID=A2D9M8_TRIV3|nr:aminophospholipid transmembrane transporter protein [Trichomonas vaginalis G3]EAY22884.1 hypothetical protein TVAG_076310 [Trichomonas vaginalis G3]KAI5527401.1 aminophospholipid transmembrane transporter protein [Trichomonas vaginalis G3]|eukprot:XP_001583870.1 hypothetical protein [Trichomonas vaginalis G3]
MKGIINIGAFKSQPIVQQDLKRLRLRSTPFCISVLFYILGVIYLILVSYYGYTLQNIQEYTKRYDEECSNKSSCIVNITIEENMKGPIALYYKLTNFYQLHRTIANSYSAQQLRGQNATDEQLQKCQPRTFINYTEHMANIYVPCGLLPAAVFNDTISLLNYSSFDESDITLSIDSSDLYLAPNDTYANSSKWLRDSGLFPQGIQDQHFIVWMRQSAFAPFRKLYAVSKSDLPKGTYAVLIQNNYPTTFFGGQKYFIISQIGMFGTVKIGPTVVFAVLAFFFYVASAIEGYIGWRRTKPSSNFHPDRLKTMFVDTSAN